MTETLPADHALCLRRGSSILLDLCYEAMLMITVANCYEIQEAFRLQMALTAANIPPDAETERSLLFYRQRAAGVRLQV